MICFPNAKINIGLNITGRRPDGFHNIETVLFPVELCDVLEFVEDRNPGNADYRLNVTGLEWLGHIGASEGDYFILAYAGQNNASTVASSQWGGEFRNDSGIDLNIAFSLGSIPVTRGSKNLYCSKVRFWLSDADASNKVDRIRCWIDANATASVDDSSGWAAGEIGTWQEFTFTATQIEKNLQVYLDTTCATQAALGIVAVQAFLYYA